MATILGGVPPHDPKRFSEGAVIVLPRKLVGPAKSQRAPRIGIWRRGAMVVGIEIDCGLHDIAL
jgi:hypothetical protein